MALNVMLLPAMKPALTKTPVPIMVPTLTPMPVHRPRRGMGWETVSEVFTVPLYRRACSGVTPHALNRKDAKMDGHRDRLCNPRPRRGGSRRRHGDAAASGRGEGEAQRR